MEVKKLGSLIEKSYEVLEKLRPDPDETNTCNEGVSRDENRKIYIVDGTNNEIVFNQREVLGQDGRDTTSSISYLGALLCCNEYYGRDGSSLDFSYTETEDFPTRKSFLNEVLRLAGFNQNEQGWRDFQSAIQWWMDNSAYEII